MVSPSEPTGVGAAGRSGAGRPGPPPGTLQTIASGGPYSSTSAFQRMTSVTQVIGSVVYGVDSSMKMRSMPRGSIDLRATTSPPTAKPGSPRLSCLFIETMRILKSMD